MKKFRRIVYIILIAIIIVLSLTIYTSASKENEEPKKEKASSEIKYLDSQLVELMNKMNNIEFENYKISTSETKEENSSSQDNNSQNGGNQGNGSSNSGNSSGENSEEGSSAGESSGGNTRNNEKGKKFSVEEIGVLKNDNNIEWNDVKNKVEILYTSIPNVTLDLYEVNVNKDDILAFNTQLDNLAIVVKEENKEKTLSELTKLYEYIPKFAKNVVEDEVYKKTLDTKLNIFKGYSILDSKDWNAILENIKNATNVYAELLTNGRVNSNKQHNINKTYIMLNEMQNAVNKQDKDIFLIKYKNILEELNIV